MTITSSRRESLLRERVCSHHHGNPEGRGGKRRRETSSPHQWLNLSGCLRIIAGELWEQAHSSLEARVHLMCIEFLAGGPSASSSRRSSMPSLCHARHHWGIEWVPGCITGTRGIFSTRLWMRRLTKAMQIAHWCWENTTNPHYLMGKHLRISNRW